LADQKKIISMFNDIAERYDIASKTVSFGVESIWKTKSIQRVLNYIDANKKIKIVDVACGTGSMLEKFQDILEQNRIFSYSLSGVDPSCEMLKIAKSRFENIDFYETQANKMPFENSSVDLISIAYGVRNIVNIDDSLDEMYRVLDKDGVLLILDFFKNKHKLSYISYIRDLYIQYIIPIVGGFISKNKESFEYLSSSIESFNTTKEFQDKLENHGFEVVYARSFSFDVSNCMIIKKTKEVKHKEVASKKSSNAKESLPFHRALKTVTMKCFVLYYKYFSQEEISNKEIVEIIRKDNNYTKDSCHSRISNARFIINNGYTKEALEYIVKANRVDDSTKRKARKILKTL